MIRYKKQNDIYLLVSVSDGKEKAQTLVFSPSINAHLRIRDRYYEVVNGEAKIDTGILADGIYYPLLISSGEASICEGICMRAGVISSAKSEESILFSLRHDMIELYDRIGALEGALADIKAVMNNNIF